MLSKMLLQLLPGLRGIPPDKTFLTTKSEVPEPGSASPFPFLHVSHRWTARWKHFPKTLAVQSRPGGDCEFSGRGELDNGAEPCSLHEICQMLLRRFETETSILIDENGPPGQVLWFLAQLVAPHVNLLLYQRGHLSQDYFLRGCKPWHSVGDQLR